MMRGDFVPRATTGRAEAFVPRATTGRAELRAPRATTGRAKLRAPRATTGRAEAFTGLTIAPETVTSSFTTFAFLALLRVLIKLFFWMDTVGSPGLNFFFRLTSSYVAWRVPNCAQRRSADRITENAAFSQILMLPAPAAGCENSPRVKN
ncbi:MAG TPA: hypothetical protein VGJ06_09020 [Candidatus Acidoferrum sp.]|jgi:hypothetical protein